MNGRMNGAESLVRTLLNGDVNVCFANPGTSEMHFVSALDRVEGVRCILGLFEGVVTGAADGYYRMADKPAATLLHLGPGLGNGLANLHNAKRRAPASSTSSASTRAITSSTTRRLLLTSKVWRGRCRTGSRLLPRRKPSLLMAHLQCRLHAPRPETSPR